MFTFERIRQASREKRSTDIGYSLRRLPDFTFTDAGKKSLSGKVSSWTSELGIVHLLETERRTAEGSTIFWLKVIFDHNYEFPPTVTASRTEYSKDGMPYMEVWPPQAGARMLPTGAIATEIDTVKRLQPAQTPAQPLPAVT